MKYLSILLVGCTLLCSGCASNKPLDVVYKTEGIIITSVDGAMKAWRDYVKAGMATQSQVDQVKVAYNKYYAAQQVARTAVVIYVASSSTNSAFANTAAITQAVDSSKNSLISLIGSFITTK